MDSRRNLYGTTFSGGQYNYGTVFKLDASNNLTVLHEFSGKENDNDGAGPQAGLVMDSDGNLYGTTISGGDCTAHPVKAVGRCSCSIQTSVHPMITLCSIDVLEGAPTEKSQSAAWSWIAAVTYTAQLNLVAAMTSATQALAQCSS
jgi:uncharacterized repeat protein (TIGR03803 family)